ncbi:hypothetical protein MN608_10342 [Microdochium nivale]|nr:hypothetical protein MN608_10342 [Microdochium nivale]
MPRAPRGFLMDYPRAIINAICRRSIKRLEAEDPADNPNLEYELAGLRNLLNGDSDSAHSDVGQSSASNTSSSTLVSMATTAFSTSDWEFISRGSSSVSAAASLAEPVRVSTNCTILDHDDEDLVAIYAPAAQNLKLDNLKRAMYIDTRTARLLVTNPVVTLAFAHYQKHFLSSHADSEPPLADSVVEAWKLIDLC